MLVLAGCVKPTSSAIGEAYVAPTTLNLRRELTQKNSTAAILNHGEHLDIVDVRRRFVKVRTAKGVEGWVDFGQLLSPAQMEQIRVDNRKAQALPSQGSATVFEALNVHIEPNRQSPAFTKIPEAGSVSVLGHRLVPKLAGPPATSPFSLLKPQGSQRRQKKDKQGKGLSLRPPKPAPPKAPANWQELSTERIDGADSPADKKTVEQEKQEAKKKEAAEKPVVKEDWTLVRTKDNQCGWVLSRNLVMSIPDDVAQYAEGKRISSYFDLGTVNDEEKGVRHDWLWTTLSEPASFDFNGWRVFIWNRHRHRYETSYRERDVEGYFPAHVDPVEGTSPSRTFQLVTKDDDGKYWRRAYVFDGTRVHLTGKEEYHLGQAPDASKASGLNMDQIQAKMPQPSWMSRQWSGLVRRFTGK